MNCNEINTSNNNGSNNAVPIIKHVYGNVLRMAIPLTKRVVTMEDGEVVATDENFIPSSNYPVSVQFVKDAIKIDIPAIMMGNVAVIEDKGTLPVGTYAIVVLCKDDEGNPYRFKQRAIARVYDVTADADIQQPIEFETKLWYLDAAIFLALQGKDGVGISETIIEESDEVGGYNIITFVFTDGTTRTFSVMNGSGAVDTIFSTTSQHPLANSVVTQRFNTIEQNLNDASDEIDNLKENSVGVVEFDENTKRLVGHPVDSESENDPIFALDFTDFLKNYFISSGFIENGVLKLQYNTEANKQDLEIDLNEHINPIEYLTKLEASQTYVLSQELEDYIKLNAAGKINYAYMPFVVLSSMNLAYNGNPTASLVGTAHYCTDGYVRYFYRYNSMINSVRSIPVAGVLYCLKTTGDLYYWDAANRVFVVANKNEIDTSGLMDKAGYTNPDGQNQPLGGIIKYNRSARMVLDFIEGIGELHEVGYGTRYGASNGHIYVGNGENVTDLGLSNDLAFLNADNNLWYRYDNGEWVQVGGSGSGGSLTQIQADWNQTNTSAVDFIKNKPTIPDVSGLALKSEIPANTSDLINDSGFVESDDLADVATSGSYNDLTDKPTIPAAQVNADWNAASGVAQVLNKPTIPTKTSDLTNDEGFITAEEVAGIVTGGDMAIVETSNYIDIFIYMADVSITPAALSLYAAQKQATIKVSGSHLKADINISVPQGFTATPSTIQQVGGVVAETDVVIAYTGADASTASGNITATSGDTTKSIPVAYTQYSGPTILADDAAISFNAGAGSTNQKTLTVQGVNLTAGISAAISGTDAAKFSISGSPISQSGGTASGTLTITYSPAASDSGTHTATLTLSSSDATSKVITLNGAVSVLTTSVDSLTMTAQKNSSSTATFTIEGSNLAGNLSIVASGTGLSVDTQSIAATDGTVEQTTVTVTFAPTATGTINGSIVISDGNISKTISVTAEATGAQIIYNKKGETDTYIEWEEGLINSSGENYTPETTPRARTKDYLPCAVSVQLVRNWGNGSMFFYDADHNYISSEWFAQTKTVDVPATAAYFRYSISNKNLSDVAKQYTTGGPWLTGDTNSTNNCGYFVTYEP